MKAADITDEAFLGAIDVVHRDRWESAPVWIGANRWDIACVLDGRAEAIGGVEATIPPPGGIPQKVIRAKAKRLIGRGLINGCACGCRGDFERIAVAAAEGSQA